ncbi:MAG: DUF1499 domain-containing protein [Silicimonas sp.]|nr:DUF1499 domain-containing protein [Silicimonas sp.]
MTLLLGFLVLALVLARLMPVDTEPFHVDPAAAEARRSEVRMVGEDAPVYPADAGAILAEFSAIALADPRVSQVQGSADEGMITFVARSLVFGFRDFITVRAEDVSGGARLSVFARPRINGYDWGVNAERLDRWLGKLEQAFGQ